MIFIYLFFIFICIGSTSFITANVAITLAITTGTGDAAGSLTASATTVNTVNGVAGFLGTCLFIYFILFIYLF